MGQLKVEDLPSPSPAWDHLPVIPFHCTALSPFPSLPSSNLLAFSSICFLLVAWPHQRREGMYQEMGQTLSSSSPTMPWWRPSGITVWNTHYITKGKEACRRQMHLNSPLSFIIVEGGNFDWAKRLCCFWALLEFNIAISVSVAYLLGHNSKQGTQRAWLLREKSDHILYWDFNTSSLI